jgi:asparagine synthase (glutamine-hydrolysing)
LYSECLNEKFEDINCLNHQLIDKSKIRNRDLLQKRSYVDYKIRLVDHLVSDHGDRMALANSVEVRYPFLDKNIAEFAAELPSELKLNDFSEKYLLKKMAGRYVPRSIIEREKFGFVAPGSPYLLQNNCEYVNDLLSFDLIKRQGYFNPHQIEHLKKMYSEKGFKVNAPFETDLLIIVLTYGILLDTFF